ISVVADQTALAPTILELAGVPKPDWMPADSLASWLFRVDAGPRGLAFSQYFEKNRIVEPLRHGTVSVIDGEYQFVYDLEAREGSLRPLAQAQVWNLDTSALDPVRAERMRALIVSR